MTADSSVEVVDAEVHDVRTITGDSIRLQTAAEVEYFNRAQERYLGENSFTQASDLRALDRLIFFETMVHRWQTQLASGRDYDGIYIDGREQEQLRKNLKETAATISTLQEDLNLTLAARQKAAHESVGSYILQLQQAAKEHGIRRERQLGKALELTKELFSLVGAYLRANESEREKLGIESAEDIVHWVDTYMKPEFDAIDQYFRENQQRFWVRKI